MRPMRTIVSKLRRKLGDDADNPILSSQSLASATGCPSGRRRIRRRRDSAESRGRGYGDAPCVCPPCHATIPGSTASVDLQSPSHISKMVLSTVKIGLLERTRTRVCRVPTVASLPSDDWGRASREGTSAPVDHRSPRVNASAYSPTDAGRRRTAGSASCANRNLFNHQQGEAEPRPQALTSMRSRAPRITHPSTWGSSLPTQRAGQVLGVCPRIRSWRRKPPRNNLLTVIWTLSWSN